jgi:DNA-binding CsgD family transcriptional regulator
VRNPWPRFVIAHLAVIRARNVFIVEFDAGRSRGDRFVGYVDNILWCFYRDRVHGVAEGRLMSELAFPGGADPLHRAEAPSLAFLDDQLVVRRVSAEFADFLAATPQDLIGQDFPALFGVDAAAVVRGRCRALLTGGNGGFVDRMPLGPSGTVRPLVEVIVVEFGGVLVASLRALAPPHEGAAKLGELDARILEAVARGESTLRIASVLFMSKQAINYRIGNLLRRFEVVNRTSLVSRALFVGVLDSQSWPPRVYPHLIE